jgi:hypothetical protein
VNEAPCQRKKDKSDQEGKLAIRSRLMADIERLVYRLRRLPLNQYARRLARPEEQLASGSRCRLPLLLPRNTGPGQASIPLREANLAGVPEYGSVLAEVNLADVCNVPSGAVEPAGAS